MTRERVPLHPARRRLGAHEGAQYAIGLVWRQSWQNVGLTSIYEKMYFGVGDGCAWEKWREEKAFIDKRY